MWFSQDIGFSRVGSLTKTLTALVDTSRAGLTAEQLGEKLRCRCHSVLVGLYRQGRIQRQRQGRCHLYLSADAQLAKIQKIAMEPRPSAQLPAEIAVMVLAEFIRHPSVEPRQLAEWVSVKAGLRLQESHIRELFKQHGLKKTLRPTPSVF